MIQCGDALDLIGSVGEVDYLLTDPPYPTGGESSMRSARGVKMARDMIDGLAQSYVWHVIRSVQKSERFSAWIFCDWRQISFLSSICRGEGLDRQSCLIWDKCRGSMSARYHPRHEHVLWASSVAAPQKYLGPDIIACQRPRPNERTHPLEKPAALVEAMCGAFPPGRVVDPFCGSGGLLVGARRLGWETHGIEIDAEMARVANERVDAARRGR